jgi:hypothetical protein
MGARPGSDLTVIYPTKQACATQTSLALLRIFCQRFKKARVRVTLPMSSLLIGKLACTLKWNHVFSIALPVSEARCNDLGLSITGFSSSHIVK